MKIMRAKMKMKFQCIISFFVTIHSSFGEDVCEISQFKRIHQVDQLNIGSEIIGSKAGIENHIGCANHCITEDECMSFSYTEGNKMCRTYSRAITETASAAESNSIKYFSKPLPSGVYDYDINGGQIQVYIDMDTEGGPWIVIQRRTSGDVGFNRNWADYKNGFGDLSGNFWLGNEKIWLLTLNPRVLRVELESWDGTNGYAQYTTFQVASEAENYRLNVQGKSGNITDSLSYHNGYGFTTSDRDHDSQEYNCAVVYEGAWWHHDCLNSNLNGPYKTYTGQTDVRSMLWNYFPSNDIGIPLKTSRMMVREA